MRTFLHRLLGIVRTRGFDAAGGGQHWEGARAVDGLNATVLAGVTTAARRAGWYARKNPWVAAAVAPQLHRTSANPKVNRGRTEEADPWH